ncbi:Strongly-conserved Zn-finger binding protein (TFIIIA) [Monascus purpureus]|uniref:Strongly-conserved Zn-finger binding protein (TFIIIA) n=1 Tax=Monascus purpureus TaxID=5098 RepID=A0A507QZD4_MONPU|nr:Strongly-conserved Zn-finger binding protein (TFIIIA) [Monascus purpureus]BDD54585.1 hypothetical protein MAP00_000191 [Monascus purpureus]
MAQKRKSSACSSPGPKRVRTRTALHDSDPIHEEYNSDPDYAFSDAASVNSDSLKETPTTPFSTCSVKYPSELKTHLCPFEGCTKAFNRPARLQEHLRSHNNERLFKCPYEGCEKTFLRTSHLNHHIKSAHTGVRDYVCDRPGCGKSFVTGSRLRRHLAAHDGRDKYRCTEYPPCNETFRKHSTLQKHIVTAHLNQKPFPCCHTDPKTGRKCPMAFDTAGHLRAHQGRMHTERRFTCTECTQQRVETILSSMDNINNDDNTVTFPTYALLQAHIKSVHPPQCPNCPVMCSTSRELRRHLEVAHGDIDIERGRLFPCTVPGCDRSFTKKGNLTVHIRTVHEGEKRFVCGETDLSTSKKVQGWFGEGCGKRYGSKLALEEHIRTAHLGFQNAKAERRQRLGLSSSKTHTNAKRQPSARPTLAALTGEGYAEETGRRIKCFYETCPHRFHRDYDLWVHMTGKHGCTEDEIQNFFLQRALLADGEQEMEREEHHESSFGIYGLEFDVVDADGDRDLGYGPYPDFLNNYFSQSTTTTTTAAPSHTSIAGSSNNHEYGLGDNGYLDTSALDLHQSGDGRQAGDFNMPGNDDIALIDPVLAFDTMIR